MIVSQWGRSGHTHAELHRLRSGGSATESTPPTHREVATVRVLLWCLHKANMKMTREGDVGFVAASASKPCREQCHSEQPEFQNNLVGLLFPISDVQIYQEPL